MRAWIGCLGSYNNGVLHGDWFDVSTDADENAKNIAKVLRSSRFPNTVKTDPETGETYATAEEHYIGDYDAHGAIVRQLGEYPCADDLARAAEISEAVENEFSDYNEAGAVLSRMFDGQRLSDIDNARQWLGDNFAGAGKNRADWCAEYLDETGFFDAIPKGMRETVENYFDFDQYAHDWECNGDFTFEQVSCDRVLVFRNR